MKKSLIALAVLAVSGAALAQSVTLYGRIDSALGSEKDQITGVSNTKIEDGDKFGLTQSRWGLRGSEDLGGGLKAIFKLESRLFSDTGAQDGVLFKAESTVGLSGGFGTVKLGRAETVFKDIRDLAISNSVFDSAFTPTKSVYDHSKSGGVKDFSSRADNQVRYDSPSFSGFSVGVSHGLDEDQAVDKDVTAFSVRYKTQTLDVGLGYQDQQSVDYTALSAKYDFGSFSVSGGYNGTDAATGVEETEYTLGANLPLGQFDISAGYANGSTKNAAGIKAAKASGFGLGTTYTLSKRTRLYAGYRTHNVKNAAGVKQEDKRLFAAGVRHDF